eukprot:COSAG01_NODE_26646_length_707_cov_1.175987_2_plen_106_part_01
MLLHVEYTQYSRRDRYIFEPCDISGRMVTAVILYGGVLYYNLSFTDIVQNGIQYLGDKTPTLLPTQEDDYGRITVRTTITAGWLADRRQPASHAFSQNSYSNFDLA